MRAREDEAQQSLLVLLLGPESEWEVYAIELAKRLVGFIAIRMNQALRIGEIGLNTVHPQHVRMAPSKLSLVKVVDGTLRKQSTRVLSFRYGGADQRNYPAALQGAPDTIEEL